MKQQQQPQTQNKSIANKALTAFRNSPTGTLIAKQEKGRATLRNNLQQQVNQHNIVKGEFGRRRVSVGDRLANNTSLIKTGKAAVDDGESELGLASLGINRIIKVNATE